MKHFIVLLIVTFSDLFILKLAAQAPQTFPYQAVARDVSGNLLANQSIALRLSVLDGSNAGPVLFAETHIVTTNTLGLFTLNIGQGVLLSGAFNTINWGSGPKYLKVELDAAGGNNFVVMGTSPLMSVPYSLFAEKSNDNVWAKNGNNISNSNTGNVGIGIAAPTSKLHTSGSVRHEGLAGSNARLVHVDAGGTLFTAQSPTISSPNANIPDNGCSAGTGSTNAITLSGYPTSVASNLMSVRLSITHTYDADLAIYLVAPNGAILRLAQNNGSSGDNFTNTVFADNAATSISSGTAPFTGSYKPIGGLTNYCSITPTVSTFGAMGGGTINPNGLWTLKVIDDANNDMGVLNNWSVEVQGYSEGGVNNYVVKWENGALSNTSNIYDNGTNVGIGTTSPTAQLHTTGTVRHESLEGEGKRIVYADSNGILNATSAPVFTSGSSSIAPGVSCNSNSIVVSGLPNSINSNGISVRLNITYPGIEYMDAYIEAPNGQKLNLTDGSYASGPDLLNAIFNDQALFAINSGIPSPHSGLFKPLGGNLLYACLSTNVNSFSAFGGGSLNPNGTWKLWVRGYSSNLQGTINNWSISFGDTVNNGYANFIPKWTNTGLKNSSLLYEDGMGLRIGTAFGSTNMLSVGGDASILGTLGVDGNLGVGTLVPQAALHVSGGAISTTNTTRSYFAAGTGSGISTNAGLQGNIVIRADGWIWANSGGFVATSDKRIKHVLSKTNNKKDLEVLDKIEITNYKYIDEIGNGGKMQKKVIAQQVEGIYPIAVNANKGMIPNVFQATLSTEIKNSKTYIETKKQHDFKTGDEVKLILSKTGEKIVKVTVINEHLFSVDEIIEEEIFVYGKQVNDLLSVDYDALTTLNISATQELYKMVLDLKAANKLLEVKLNSLTQHKGIAKSK